MKITSKRLVSVLLCLAFALAMLPVAVFAESASTIYVQPNSNWLSDGARFAAYFYGNGETWVDCTDADGDGNYVVAVPDGYTSVIFCRMNPATTENNWDNKWNQTADLSIPTDDKVVYVVDGWDKGNGQWIEIGGEPEEVEVVYYLRGTMNDWGTDIPLTDNGDGTWSVTVALAAGTYEYKAADAGWGTSYPSGSTNASVTIDADCDVTFVLDTNAGTVTATADSVVEPELPVPVVYDYYVAGGAGLCGVEWDPAQNQMTQGEDGLYSITFTDVAAGTYEYKITTGSWDTPSYGYGEGNYTVVTTAWLSNVTITFNAQTTEVNASVEVAVATEPGAADIKWQLNADASGDDESVDLRLISWVDSLDYSNVTFNVTLDGETAELDINTVYTAINADGFVVDDVTGLFGEDAAYFVTYTIEGLTADYFDSEIAVSVSWEALDGTVTTSEARTIVVSVGF